MVKDAQKKCVGFLIGNTKRPLMLSVPALASTFYKLGIASSNCRPLGSPLNERNVINYGWVLTLLLVGCQKSNEVMFLDAVAEVREERANSIDFRDRPLHDESLIAELKGLSELRNLNLDRSQVSDAALNSIGPLPGLSKLSLSRTQLTNDGLKAVAANYPNLIFLRLDETLVDDVGMESLANLKKLEELSLYRVPVTSRGAATIAKMESLRTLSLDQSMVTDAGLEALGQMSQVKVVSIWQCQVSDNAVEKFQRDHPLIKLNR